MTDNIPENNVELDSRIADLADKCARLKATADASEKAFKMAKSELETLCEEAGLSAVATENVKVTIRKQRRFRAYRDTGAVMKLIPENVLPDVQVLDRKKIDELIGAGVLPHAIKDEEMYTETTATTFRKV